MLLDDYIRPNNLEFDEEFMTRGVVPAVLNALGKFCSFLHFAILIMNVIDTLYRRS